MQISSHSLVSCLIVNLNKHCFTHTVYSFLRPRVGYSAAYKSVSSTRYLRNKNSPKFGRFQPSFSRVNTQNIQIVDLNPNGTWILDQNLDSIWIIGRHKKVGIRMNLIFRYRVFGYPLYLTVKYGGYPNTYGGYPNTDHLKTWNIWIQIGLTSCFFEW